MYKIGDIVYLENTEAYVNITTEREVELSNLNKIIDPDSIRYATEFEIKRYDLRNRRSYKL